MNADTPQPQTARKKPGPKPKAAEVTESPEEMRARIEAEVRAQVEAEVRAKVDEEAKVNSLANEARPINGLDITGKADVEGSILVHFVEDGLTLLGKVWYRGEELAINPGTPQWEEAYEILSLNEYDQEERWGRRFFREGPWRGKRLDEIDSEELTEAERKQLKKAEQLRRARLGI